MVSVEDIKIEHTLTIILGIIITGLGFYFAIVLAETMRITLDAILPKQENEVVTAWIILAISFLIVAILVVILVRLIKMNEHR